MKLIYPFIVAGAMLMSCSPSQQSNNAKDGAYTLQNGLYLLLNEYEEHPGKAVKGPIVEFSHDFLEGNTAGQPLYLEIDTTELVRLDLKHAPEGVEQEDKRINLFITLTEGASTKLAQFTEKHIGNKVAIVIGGKAVTKHKVRSKIDGGRLQITRCTDNACEHLLLELKENYK